MDLEMKKKSLPNTVLALYVRLYCKRRNIKKNKMMEAIQSWVTLSKVERDYFLKKFEECHHNHKIRLAKYLKSTQPYMKKKKYFRVPSNVDKRNAFSLNEGNKEVLRNDIVEEVREECKENEKKNPDPFVKDHNNEINNQTIETSVCILDAHQHNNSHIQDDYESILSEPTPPSIRSGRELFDLIQESKGNNDYWATLPRIQKSRYQRAVSFLKNDYITRFNAYLWSLPPKELYNYYNNFFD